MHHEHDKMRRLALTEFDKALIEQTKYFLTFRVFWHCSAHYSETEH
jgi:hypothetical protein